MNKIQIVFFTLMIINGLYIFVAKKGKNVEFNATIQWVLLALYFMVK